MLSTHIHKQSKNIHTYIHMKYRSTCDQSGPLALSRPPPHTLVLFPPVSLFHIQYLSTRDKSGTLTTHVHIHVNIYIYIYTNAARVDTRPKRHTHHTYKYTYTRAYIQTYTCSICQQITKVARSPHVHMCTCMHTHKGAYIHTYTCSICEHTTRAALSPSLALSGARTFVSLSVCHFLSHSLTLSPTHTVSVNTRQPRHARDLSLSLSLPLSLSLSLSLSHTLPLSQTHTVSVNPRQDRHAHPTYTYAYTNTYIHIDTHIYAEYIDTQSKWQLTTRTHLHAQIYKYVHTCTCSICQHATPVVFSPHVQINMYIHA